MQDEVYLPYEIATAAGVPLEQVVAAVGGTHVYVPHRAAVILGRKLARANSVGTPHSPLFATVYSDHLRSRTLRAPLALAASFQSALIGMAVVASIGAVPGRIGSRASSEVQLEPVRLVYLAIPGPGGGGGGGGLKDPVPASAAKKRGPRETGNPVVASPPPDPDPTPQPLDAESFPVLVAPIAPIVSGTVDVAGTIDSKQVDQESHGPGRDGGAGTGTGSGLGSGTGAGIGAGVGGGTGGGVYRPGSGVVPPRLVHEVKPDYPDTARRRRVEGEVVMELIVRRDGAPTDIRIIRRLGPEFDGLAVDAVRQWRFEPGRMQGTPVDVAVEVSVDFRLR